MKNPVFTPNFIDEFWKRTFPHAEVVRLTDAGHYLVKSVIVNLT